MTDERAEKSADHRPDRQIYPFHMKIQPWRAGKRAPPTGRKRLQCCKMIWKGYTI